MAEKKKENLVSTGIDGLDHALGGGMMQGSAALIRGEPGSGKSSLAAQFVYSGAKYHNEPGVYITFDESEEKAREYMESFGWDVKSLEEKNLLRIERISALQLQQFAKQESMIITESIRNTGAKRVAVDALNSFELIFERDYERLIYTRKLIDGILRDGCTLLATVETDDPERSAFLNLDYMFEAIIVLRVRRGKKVERTLEVLRVKGSGHREGESPMSVTSSGVEVYPQK
jgi:circadian clock protein KaiC